MLSVENNTHRLMARSGDGSSVPPRRRTKTQMSALNTTANWARKSLYPINCRRDTGAENKIDTSACVNASAVASEPKTHEPISVITASSVTIISVGRPMKNDVPPPGGPWLIGRSKNPQRYSTPTTSAAA